MADDCRRKCHHSDERSLRTMEKDHYRIVMLGSAGVGKTCIVSQFMYDTFPGEYKATVEELHSRQFQISGKFFTLELLDTAGSYVFPAMRKLAITSGDAFVLVCSVDDGGSFEQASALWREIREQKQQEQERTAASDGAGTPIVVAANKADLGAGARALSREKLEATARLDWNNQYLEVSAKENVNITGIFKALLAQTRLSFDISSASFAGSARHPLKKAKSCVVS